VKDVLGEQQNLKKCSYIHQL